MSKQKIQSFNKRSPLAKRFIIYLILFSASITLITTAIQLYSEYKRDIENIESQQAQIKNVLLRSFTQSLWATNYQELRFQLEGLVKLPNLVYASVHNGKKLIAETGSSDAKNIIKHQYEMRYEFLGKKNKIGVLTVVTTLDDIYSDLLRNATTILISNALRTFFVVIFIYFMFHHLISRHISQISQHFQRLALGKNESLVLERKPSQAKDELDLLVSSANEMQTRINGSHQAFRDSEKKYQTLITVAPVGIFYTDKNGACLYVNETWSEITGVPAEQAMGNGWMAGLHVDDSEGVFSQWTTAAKEDVPFKLEYRFKINKKTCWVLGQAIAEKNDAGEVLGYVGTITDITERKKIEKALIESEKQLRLIHSQVPGIVYQFKIDAKGNRSFPYMSPASKSYAGLTAEEVMADADKWFALAHPDDNANLEKSIVESMNNLSVWNWRGRIIRNDGEVVWLSGTSTPEKTDDDSIIWYGLFIDITKHVQADETVRRTQKMDALGKLTGGIAHDYNNMLGVVLGFAELLDDALAGQYELKQYVEQIKRAGERGVKLTDRLLSFSRNKLSNTEHININTMLKNEKHMLEKTLTARIKLDFNLQENLWQVHLDESELEDAILNISINAMHAIENNGSLTIETKNEQLNWNEAKELGVDSGNYVKLSFIDTGCGMDEATKDKIFDPFYSTKGAEGTGLGLSQVYGFISRCGGAIKVDSVLQQGTRFNLYFPKSIDNNIEVKSKPSEIKKKESLKGKETILVVDDELPLLALTSAILEQHDYQVFCAERGKQALEIMAQEKIDVLISDIIMPEMDGYELTAIVQEKYPDIKIQLVSGFTGADEKQPKNTTLSDNFLQKPYSTEALLDRIRHLLQ